MATVVTDTTFFVNSVDGITASLAQFENMMVSNANALTVMIEQQREAARLSGNIQWANYLEQQKNTLSHVQNNPALQAALKDSFATLRNQMISARDIVLQDVATATSTVSKVQLWNKMFSELGKFGNVAGPLAAGYQIADTYANNNSDVMLGRSVISNLGQWAAVAGVSAVVAAIGLTVGTVTAGVAAAGLAAIGINYIVDTFLPQEWAEAVGEYTRDFLDGAGKGFQWVWDNTQLDEWGESLGGWVADLVHTNFSASQNWIAQVRRDPLTFDLDGDGIESIAENGTAGVMFDHEGDGVKTATGWVSPDDGFLVYDRNGNGLIDNGTELFGDSTPVSGGGTAANGFEALADLDTNADGKVDVSDTDFANLRIWQDKNSDGISQADELLTLDEAGIASINTAYDNSNIAQNGNLISALGSYTKTDGSASSVGSSTALGDFDLANSTFHSQFIDSVALTPEAELLPTMKGSGLVRNINQVF